MGLYELLDEFMDVLMKKIGNVKSRATVDIYYSVMNNFYSFLFDKYGKRTIIFKQLKKGAI